MHADPLWNPRRPRQIALSEVPPGEFEGSTAIAEKVGAPPNYLGKLLQALARTGVVSSRKGLGGGWALGREPREIRLLDIVEPVEDVARWRGCFLGREECSDEHPCHVHTAWAPVRDAFFNFVEGTTLFLRMRAGGAQLALLPLCRMKANDVEIGSVFLAIAQDSRFGRPDGPR